ncbi:uracil-DNA glycosylase [Magnetospira sp. QH-2]|uniref:uracil-DNA glycosylase n=1 Tax=Magnetospira sp. (strain QH-2) TaxID=1288970 RepID=UPI0003E81C12|nr:uracil-DNA glycosylase [Magnetospira sp. QH-2]CCQ73567.1 Uracil-DNA glycosylase [Magnetospira sp. QH-2]
MVSYQDPARDCPRCPRLGAFLGEQRDAHPDWFNAPVPAFGGLDATLLVAGLAPGLRGANRTGRPFTGDWAGDLLYPTLIAHGLAKGTFGADPDDGLEMVNCRITNAVRCVPPENKPTGPEVTACRPFLIDEMAAMPNLRVVLCLGGLSHGAVLSALGEKKSAWPFKHGSQYRLSSGLILADSYHCSRYNTNTGRLTEAMFHQVFQDLLPLLS